MAAPTVNFVVYGTAPNEYATEEGAEGALNVLSGLLWEQMHQLAADGVIDLVNETASAPNVITASLRGAHADTPAQGGVTYVIRIPTVGLLDTGPFLIAVGSGEPWPVIDELGSPADLAAFIKGQHYHFRRGLDEEATFRAMDTDRAMWEQVARGDTIPVLTASVAGTANDVTARLSSVYNRLVIGPGTKFQVPFRQTNTGEMNFQIHGKDATLAPLLNADGNPCRRGEVIGGRTYTVFRSGANYKLLTDFTLQQIEAMIAAGGGGGGDGGGQAERRAHVAAKLEGSTIRSYGDHDGVVAELGPLTAVTQPEGGRYVSLVVDRPSIGPTTLVGGRAGYNLLVPCAPNILHGCIGAGQSQIMGAESGSSLVTTAQPWPDDALMVDGLDVRLGLGEVAGEVLDPATMLGFRPLVAMPGAGTGNRGETPMEGFARRVTSLAREMDIQHRLLCFVAGRGGTSYSGLKKGTQIWDNMLIAIDRIQELAAEVGLTYLVDGVLLTHGTAGQSDPNYGDYVTEWQHDLDTDIRAATGQMAPVHMFVTIPSSPQSGILSTLGMVAARSDVIHIAGAEYPFADGYSPDFLHSYGPGYQLAGEQAAMAWVDEFWRPAGGQTPVMMTGASRSGTAVTLPYAVPNPPLVIDTVSITDPNGQCGFRFFAGSVEIPITAVTVTNPGTGGAGAIGLTLASAPAGGAERVEYALDLQTDPRTLEGVPRGNVRDSAPERSQYDGRHLYRRAIPQRVEL